MTILATFVHRFINANPSLYYFYISYIFCLFFALFSYVFCFTFLKVVQLFGLKCLFLFINISQSFYNFTLFDISQKFCNNVSVFRLMFLDKCIIVLEYQYVTEFFIYNLFHRNQKRNKNIKKFLRSIWDMSQMSDLPMPKQRRQSLY